MCMILWMVKMSSGRDTESVIVQAILTIVAEKGLDHATVREAAAVAGVSIGTVQHHFPTKDEMLLGAFSEVVRRVRGRLASADLGGNPWQTASFVLREILPLDEPRRQEARVQLAFATRSMHDSGLAAIQRKVLEELHLALSAALASPGQHDAESAGRTAHALVALADGLALHALSTDGWLSPGDIDAALALVLDKVIDHSPDQR